VKLSRTALLDFLRVRYVADLYDEDIVDKFKDVNPTLYLLDGLLNLLAISIHIFTEAVS
jgi:hypothetical protein